jgi:hypothetical protein
MAKFTTYKLTNNLIKIPLNWKLLFLVVGAIALYLPHFFLYKINLPLYFTLFTSLVCSLASICYLVIGSKNFKMIIKLWAIGTIVYCCFAIPRIYLASKLSPYFIFTSLSDRWLYSLLLPLMLLGTFSVGLIFVRITTPLEFLKWGRCGIKIALLLRVLQHSMQVLNDTKLALMMQNKWPDTMQNKKNFRENWLLLKYSPLLISTALRNIIIYWFPWGMVCFKRKIEIYKQNMR